MPAFQTSPQLPRSPPSGPHPIPEAQLGLLRGALAARLLAAGGAVLAAAGRVQHTNHLHHVCPVWLLQSPAPCSPRGWRVPPAVRPANVHLRRLVGES